MKHTLRLSYPPILVITVKGPARQKEIEALLDTGASYNVISVEDARDLGYNLDTAAKTKINIAGGSLRVPVIKLQNMSLLGFSKKRVSTMVLDMNNSKIRAIIGWSFLKHFYFSFEPKRNAFTFGQ